MINLAAESWLVTRLGQHGAGVFTGLTDPDIRRERIREAITSNGLECVVVGANDRKPETYAQAFERIYAQPLGTPHRKARATPAPQPAHGDPP